MDTSQANLIKAARQRLYWSQRDLARQLGISPGYIALLEQAVRSPSPDLWHRISDLFRADPRSQDLFHQDVNDDTELMGHATFGAAPAFAPEFPVEFPLDPSWFAHIPFTVVAGPAGTGKTTFLRSCGEALETKGVRRVFWASLNTFQNDLGQLRAELLRFFAEEAAPSSGTVEISLTVSADQPMQVARMVASHIEDRPRLHTILCFDDWQPHAEIRTTLSSIWPQI